MSKYKAREFRKVSFKVHYFFITILMIMDIVTFCNRTFISQSVYYCTATIHFACALPPKFGP